MLKNAVTLIFLCFALIMVSACEEEKTAGQRVVEEYAHIDELPDNYKELVIEAGKRVLKDGYSAKYEFEGDPIKNVPLGKSGNSEIAKLEQELGLTTEWNGFVMINAKNSYGAYTGFKKYMYTIHKKKVVRLAPVSK